MLSPLSSYLPLSPPPLPPPPFTHPSLCSPRGLVDACGLRHLCSICPAAAQGLPPAAVHVRACQLADERLLLPPLPRSADGLPLVMPVAILHAAAFALGYFICKFLRFDEKTARTVSIETGMQSAALGFLLAQVRSLSRSLSHPFPLLRGHVTACVPGDFLLSGRSDARPTGPVHRSATGSSDPSLFALVAPYRPTRVPRADRRSTSRTPSLRCPRLCRSSSWPSAGLGSPCSGGTVPLRSDSVFIDA